MMVESHLVGGRQDLVPGKPLRYGQSITDGCIDWDTSVDGDGAPGAGGQGAPHAGVGSRGGTAASANGSRIGVHTIALARGDSVGLAFPQQ